MILWNKSVMGGASLHGGRKTSDQSKSSVFHLHCMKSYVVYVSFVHILSIISKSWFCGITKTEVPNCLRHISPYDQIDSVKTRRKGSSVFTLIVMLASVVWASVMSKGLLRTTKYGFRGILAMMGGALL